MQGECREEAERGSEKGGERHLAKAVMGGMRMGRAGPGGGRAQRGRGAVRGGRRIARVELPGKSGSVGKSGTSALGIYARFRPRFRRRVLIGKMGGKGGPAVSNKNLNG